VVNAGTTGAGITGNTLNAAYEGTVIIRATIANGAAAGTDFFKDFSVGVNAAALECGCTGYCHGHDTELECGCVNDCQGHEPEPTPTPRPTTAPGEIPTVDVNYTLIGNAVSVPLSEVGNIITEALNHALANVPPFPAVAPIPAARLDFTEVSNASSVTVPNILLNNISAANIHVEFALPQGSITLGTSAAANIANQSHVGGTTTLSVRYAVPADLSAAQAATAGGRPVFELRVTNAVGHISDLGGPVEVRMPYTLLPHENPHSLVVYHLSTDGSLTVMPNSRYENGYVVFTTDHFSRFLIGYNVASFNDLAGHWSQSAVEYAAARGLVRGHGDGTFTPEAYTTRAQFAQFVFNALNIGHVPNAPQPYSDVTVGDWYYDTVATLKHYGILDGLSLFNGGLMPEAYIYRWEMALVLANVAKIADISAVNNITASAFIDLRQLGEAAGPVVAAVNAGLLNPEGMGDGTFQPFSLVTRAQAATIQQSLVGALGRLD
jgi:hypothetical protein